MRAFTEKSKGNKKLATSAEGAKMSVVPSATSAMKAASSLTSCSNCAKDAKCRRRAFSEQAWTVLLLWNEISPASVDQPICESCYEEMRDILIDRADEIEVAMEQREEVEKIRKKLHNLAS